MSETISTYSTTVNEHYGAVDITAAIMDGLRAQGTDLANVQLRDLAPVDQYHTRGPVATMELAHAANPKAGERVLDVGGGLGGAARTLAQQFGCDVVVLDLTREFIRAGEALTELTHLADRVQFQWGSALDMPFEDNSFDLVWTQHASMNIENKDKLYSEIARVLRTGGRFAMHDIMAGRHQPVYVPVPWATTADISFLETPAQLHKRLAKLGFSECMWVDHTEIAYEFFRQREQAISTGVLPPLGLHLFMGDRFAPTFHNMVKNFQEQRVAVVQGVFEKEK